MPLEIRHPLPAEHEAVHRLVFGIVNETYGDIWPTRPIVVGQEDWGAGWIAASDGRLMGWMLTQDCWVEDLWLADWSRAQGVGSALLAQAEREIAARGIGAAFLSVIASNVRAIAFYERRGWRRHRELPHELLSIPRIEMMKTVG